VNLEIESNLYLFIYLFDCLLVCVFSFNLKCNNPFNKHFPSNGISNGNRQSSIKKWTFFNAGESQSGTRMWLWSLLLTNVSLSPWGAALYWREGMLSYLSGIEVSSRIKYLVSLRVSKRVFGISKDIIKDKNLILPHLQPFHNKGYCLPTHFHLDSTHFLSIFTHCLIWWLYVMRVKWLTCGLVFSWSLFVFYWHWTRFTSWPSCRHDLNNILIMAA